jgi:hypothetical protein
MIDSQIDSIACTRKIAKELSRYKKGGAKDCSS